MLKQDPPTFSAACQIAEQLARLDAVIDERFNTSHNKKNKQAQDTNPYNQGGFLLIDVQMSLLDYLQVPRKHNVQYDRNYHSGLGGYCNNYTQYGRKYHNNTNGNYYNRRQYNRNYNQNNNQNNNPQHGLTCYLCKKPNHIACNCHSQQSNSHCGRLYSLNQGQLNRFTENDNDDAE